MFWVVVMQADPCTEVTVCQGCSRRLGRALDSHLSGIGLIC